MEDSVWRVVIIGGYLRVFTPLGPPSQGEGRVSRTPASTQTGVRAGQQRSTDSEALRPNRRPDEEVRVRFVGIWRWRKSLEQADFVPTGRSL